MNKTYGGQNFPEWAYLLGILIPAIMCVGLALIAQSIRSGTVVRKIMYPGGCNTYVNAIPYYEDTQCHGETYYLELEHQWMAQVRWDVYKSCSVGDYAYVVRDGDWEFYKCRPQE